MSRGSLRRFGGVSFAELLLQLLLQKSIADSKKRFA
jgi:hypothetical protein